VVSSFLWVLTRVLVLKYGLPGTAVRAGTVLLTLAIVRCKYFYKRSEFGKQELSFADIDSHFLARDQSRNGLLKSLLLQFIANAPVGVAPVFSLLLLRLHEILSQKLVPRWQAIMFLYTFLQSASSFSYVCLSRTPGMSG
jgi:hypothetical protein